MMEKFQVSSSKTTYRILDKILGKGAYGVVLLSQDLNNNNYYAAKIISKKSLSVTDIENLRSEINIQTQLKHPNIVALIDAFENNDYLYLILEYCSGGSLFDILQIEGQFKEERAFYYFIQIIQAVKYLHQNCIAHRDIKLSNILLINDKIKLADFTWSAQLKQGYTSPQFCGTLEYMPPEVKKNEFQTEKVDIWSLGIVLYELLHNTFPNCNQVFFKNGLSLQCQLFIKQLLAEKPYKRPNCVKILSSEWIQQFTYRNNYLTQDNKRIFIEAKSPIMKINQFGSPITSPIRTTFTSTIRSPIGSPIHSPIRQMQSPQVQLT